MRLHIDMDWLIRVLLVSVRLSAMLWATPLFALGRVPAQVKLLAVVAFSAGLSSGVLEFPAPATTLPALIGAAAAELLIGALMAFGLYCALGAFQLGGRLLDLQTGFGVASVINPSSEEQDPLLGTLLLLVGVMTLYLIDGHLWLARGFAQSYQWLPPGRLPEVSAIDALLAQFGLMFTMGTVLVAPIVGALLLLDLGLAMAAKTMPQLNVFLLGMPVKIVLGLLMLAALAPRVGEASANVLESVFAFWRTLAER